MSALDRLLKLGRGHLNYNDAGGDAVTPPRKRPRAGHEAVRREFSSGGGGPFGSTGQWAELSREGKSTRELTERIFEILEKVKERHDSLQERHEKLLERHEKLQERHESLEERYRAVNEAAVRLATVSEAPASGTMRVGAYRPAVLRPGPGCLLGRERTPRCFVTEPGVKPGDATKKLLERLNTTTTAAAKQA